MQFDFKLNFNKTDNSKSQMTTLVGVFRRRAYRIVFSFLLIGAVLFGAYVWQKGLSGGKWTEEKKQEYLNAHRNGIVFKANDYEKAINDVESRRKEEISDSQPMKDIFK